MNTRKDESMTRIPLTALLCAAALALVPAPTPAAPAYADQPLEPAFHALPANIEQIGRAHV